MGLTFLDTLNFMKTESPVFIVGAARSGTSILYRLLQNHSSFKLQKIAGDSGPNLVESNIFQKPYNTANPTLLNYLLEDKHQYSQFLEGTEWIRRYQNLLFAKSISGKVSRRNRLPLIREIFWQLTMSNFLVAIFFYYAKQARGGKRILEKTPSSIYRLPEIKKTFPRSQLLFIHRHPLDVYSSYKKRLQTSRALNLKESELRWLQISPERFCSDYESSIRLALRESEFNSAQFMLVAYEELVSKPADTIQQICHFLNEPYEEECIVKDETKERKWEFDPHLFGEIKKTTKNWQDFVTSDEAISIENRLHQVMNKLGYARYSNSK